MIVPMHDDEESLRRSRMGLPPIPTPAPLPAPGARPMPPAAPSIAPLQQQVRAELGPRLRAHNTIPPEVGEFVARGGQLPPRQQQAPEQQQAPTERDPNLVGKVASGLFAGFGGRDYDSQHWGAVDEARNAQASQAKKDAELQEQKREAADLKRTTTEDQDPGSQSSARARATVSPLLRQLGLSDDEIGTMSKADVVGMTQGGNLALKLAELRKRKESEEAERVRGEADSEKKRTQELEDRKEMARYQDDLIRGRKGAGAGGGGGGGGGAAGGALELAQNRLQQYYAGKGAEVPPTVQARLDAIGAMPGKQRPAAIAKLWTDLAGDEKDAAAMAERRAKEEAAAAGKVAEADQEQSEAYGKEERFRGVDRGASALENVRRVLHKHVAKGGDVPGFGKSGWVPGSFLTPEGKEMRRAVNEMLDTKLRIATGAAAPPSEFKTFREILGVGPLATDSDLLSALEQAQSILQTQRGYIREMYPNARQGQPQPPPAPSGGGGKPAAAAAPTAQGPKMLILEDGSSAADTPSNRKTLDAQGVKYERR